MNLQARLAEATSRGSSLVFVSLWVIANVYLPTHFWLLKYNTLESKGDVPFNPGNDPSTMRGKVLFKCFCVFLKVSCCLSWSMTALTMCRWTWTKLSQTWVRKFLPLDKFEAIHKWCAVIGWMELLTVTLIYLINWAKLCEYYRAGNEDWNFCADFYSEIMITGYLLTFFHTVIIFLSLKAIRRKRYEFFYWTHHLSIVILLLAIFHPMDWRHRKGAKERMQTWPVLILPVTWYLVDRGIQIVTHRWTTCYNCVLLKDPKTIFLKLHSPSGFLHQRPGMICWLNVPPISWLNWHPFSIAHTDVVGSLHLIIHVIPGGWTEAFWNALVMCTPHVPFAGQGLQLDDEGQREDIIRAMTHKFNTDQAQDQPRGEDEEVAKVAVPRIELSHLHRSCPPSTSDSFELQTEASPRLATFLTPRVLNAPSDDDSSVLRVTRSMAGTARKAEASVQTDSVKPVGETGPEHRDGSSQPESATVRSERAPSELTPDKNGERRERAPCFQQYHLGAESPADLSPEEGSDSTQSEDRTEGALDSKHPETRLLQKMITGEDIGRGLFRIRNIYADFKARHGRGALKAFTQELEESKDLIPMCSQNRQVWLANVPMIEQLHKWSGTFGLSGPFTAGVPAASHYDHAILVGGGSGIVPCLSHVTQFVGLTDFGHRGRHTANQPVRQCSKAMQSLMSPRERSFRQEIQVMIETSPYWSFFWYIYILVEFTVGVGSLGMSVNRSLERKGAGEILWPIFATMHIVCALLFLAHRICLSLAKTPSSAAKLLQSCFDWCLALLGLVLLLINWFGSVKSIEADLQIEESGWKLRGGIVSTLTWDYVCHITTVGGYFCDLRMVERPELWLAETIFVGIFLCSTLRWCRVWAQTPRLLTEGPSMSGALASWEKDIGLKKSSQLRTVTLIWIMRSPSWLLHFEAEVLQALSVQHPGFEMEVYFTGSGLTQALIDEAFPNRLLRDRIFLGRPDLADIFTRTCYKHISGITHGEKVAIFASGPAAMQTAAKVACDQTSATVWEATGGKGGQVSWHAEKFG